MGQIIIKIFLIKNFREFRPVGFQNQQQNNIQNYINPLFQNYSSNSVDNNIFTFQQPKKFQNIHKTKFN